ncbi:MAG: TIGR01244 family phosphatase [Cytophagales bacterium]|nr:TIGR01244 family phosphatase [Rhizobacter sp.]
MIAPQIQQISADVCVAGQLDADAMAWAAQNGFKSVINNRPDFEGGPDQPTSATIEAAAKAAGLQYAFLPVSPAVQTPQEIARMAQLLAELPKPILAFCRTGTRSGKLYRAAVGG